MTASLVGFSGGFREPLVGTPSLLSVCTAPTSVWGSRSRLYRVTCPLLDIVKYPSQVTMDWDSMTP